MGVNHRASSPPPQTPLMIISAQRSVSSTAGNRTIVQQGILNAAAYPSIPAK